MSKRDSVLQMVTGDSPPDFVPAAFFLHFDPAYHKGQAAVNRHLEFFRFTGMDFLKIQYEQTLPPGPVVHQPADWASVPLYPLDFHEESAAITRGLVQAAGSEALVVMTVYSPFMWARRISGAEVLEAHLREDPEGVAKGLAIMTDNVLNLVRACKQAGVDGFYVSSQGGEADRFPGSDIFAKYIKPTDLAVWDEIQDCAFNILHICDYESGYDDLSTFVDYPGQVVNCSLSLGDRELSPMQVAEMFGRPYMGGLERTGVLASGPQDAIQRQAQAILATAPERFILAADCTVPADVPWDNLRTAIETAHQYRR
jgi:uroporphyrinogen decarboxylase